MCGISGFFNPYMNFFKDEAYWRHTIKKMNDSIRHRGPDDSGGFLSETCGLGHVRLSIIDLKGGHQPMVKVYGSSKYLPVQQGNIKVCHYSRLRTVAIVYNGEIYNMNELRAELNGDAGKITSCTDLCSTSVSEPVYFDTNSDTEVILNGYISEGIDFIKKLNGIFSFAIYDSLNGMYIVRDRLGVKPLFYTETGNDFIFSSEIKGLFAHPLVKPVIDHNSLRSVFGLGPAKKQGSGVFKNIREVLPGHYLHIDRDGVEDVIYWQLISKPHTDSLSQTIDKTAYLVEDSISMEMLSDIPICTFLSGGIDSSIVSAICAKKLAQEGKTLTTYSFDFKDNGIYFKSNDFQPSEDRPFVDIMKEHIGSEHIYLECSYEKLFDLLYNTVDARDLPCMTDVESSLQYFCGLVSQNHKVTLTGECADEIFGGYPWFHKKELLFSGTFPWSVDLSPRTMFLKDDVKETLDIPGYVRQIYDQSIAATPRLMGENIEDAMRREVSYLNLTWFMTTLLDRMDRTSMYHGLEARVPFADHRIVEYLWNVPWEMKYCNNTVKGLLRAATEKLGVLPDSVLHRRKSPYPKTYHPGYEAVLCKHFNELLNSPSEPVHELIDKDKAIAFMNSEKDYGKPWYGQLMAGPQLIAYILQVNYWMKMWT